MENYQERPKRGQMLLAFDTSTTSLTVGLLDGDRLVEQDISYAERNHSLLLAPMIHKLLQSQGIQPTDLAGIVVGIGPGSYTGVRIGITMAKTMAWALKLPVWTLSSLEMLAFRGVEAVLELGLENIHDVPAQPRHVSGIFTEIEEKTVSDRVWFVPLMDARRGQAYTALFEKDRVGRWRRLLPDGIRLIEGWLDNGMGMAELLPITSGGGEGWPDKVVFVGETDGFRAHIERFCIDKGAESKFYATEIRASDMGELLVIPDSSVKRLPDPHDLIPNYTQLTEAEVNWLGKAGAAQP